MINGKKIIRTFFDFEITQNESNNHDSTLHDEEFIMDKTKNHTCYICGKSFARLSIPFKSFIQHLILVHFQQDIIDHFQLKADTICKQRFSQKPSLTRHLGIVHRGILKYTPKCLHNILYPESKTLEEEEMKTANNDDSTLEKEELTNKKVNKEIIPIEGSDANNESANGSSVKTIPERRSNTPNPSLVDYDAELIINDTFEVSQTENTTNFFEFDITQNGDKSTLEDEELIMKKDQKPYLLHLRQKLCKSGMAISNIIATSDISAFPTRHH